MYILFFKTIKVSLNLYCNTNLPTHVDGALDLDVVRERSYFLTLKLSRHSLDITNFKSDGKVSWLDALIVCFLAGLRGPKSICISAGSGSLRRLGVLGAELDCLI